MSPSWSLLCAHLFTEDCNPYKRAFSSNVKDIPFSSASNICSINITLTDLFCHLLEVGVPGVTGVLPPGTEEEEGEESCAGVHVSLMESNWLESCCEEESWDCLGRVSVITAQCYITTWYLASLNTAGYSATCKKEHLTQTQLPFWVATFISFWVVGRWQVRQLQELLSLRQDSGQGPHSYLLSLRSSRVIVTEDKVRHRLGDTLHSYFISAIRGQSSEKSVTAMCQVRYVYDLWISSCSYCTFLSSLRSVFLGNFEIIYFFTRNHKFECVIVVLKVVSKVVF